MNKDTNSIANAYKNIYIKESAAEVTTDNVDTPAMAQKRQQHLEKPENYMFILKSKGFKQVESGGSLNKFVRGKDVVTVDKDLAGGFVVTINGVAYKGTLNDLHKVTK